MSEWEKQIGDHVKNQFPPGVWSFTVDTYTADIVQKMLWLMGIIEGTRDEMMAQFFHMMWISHPGLPGSQKRE